MSCTFIFVREHLLAVGTTRAAAIRNAARAHDESWEAAVDAGQVSEYATKPPAFNPRHHDVRIEEATRGAYEEVQAQHGDIGRAEFNRELGKYALPRR